MARPTKVGLSYFPMDVGFLRDKKMRLLKTEFGANSVLFVLYVLCKIYEEDGYFLRWDKDEALIATEELGCGVTPSYISEVLKGCLARSLFDEGVFKMFGVLTSAGIQRRYLSGCEKRADISIVREYWVLDVDTKKDVTASMRDKLAFTEISWVENAVNSPDNPLNSPFGTQSKVKKSKVNKTKENDIPEEIREAWSGYLDMRQKIKRPLTDKGIALALKTLNELAPEDFSVQRSILNQSVFYSWVGLFALKNNEYGKVAPKSIPTIADYAHENDFLKEAGP